MAHRGRRSVGQPDPSRLKALVALSHGGKALAGFALLLACAAAFVWLTALSLPAVVASHFEGDGYANGFMSRGAYVGFTLAFVVGLPALLLLLSHFAFGRPGARINLPNREYWLSPERRDETVSTLRGGLRQFMAMLVVFLCYVHWLVVRANQTSPPRLSTPWMIGGLVAFGAFALVWTRRLLRRFRARPSSQGQERARSDG